MSNLAQLLLVENDSHQLVIVLKSVDDSTQHMSVAIGEETAVMFRDAIERFLKRVRRDVN